MKTKISNIISRISCKKLTFKVSALLLAPDLSILNLPENWIKTGKDFQDNLDDETCETLSELAADQNPDWDDNLDRIIYLDTSFGWKWQDSSSTDWQAGQRLIKWLRRKKNQPHILAAIFSNTTR